MTRFKSQVISLGRITIPKDVRDDLKLEEGDYVQIEGIKKLVPEPNPAEKAEEAP